MKIIQDMDQAIGVMQSAGKWMKESGKNPSKWWQLENLNQDFLLRHVKENEFYVGFVGGVPAVAAVFILLEDNPDWKSVDKDYPKRALYIHWLCVDRQFAGQGLPKVMVDFSQRLAKKNGISMLRLDANADKKKLQDIYEDLGFRLLGTKQEDSRTSAFYQKTVV
ncbi:MAG: GNAT family N-acetyltransferase [Patescibacteria group bacterium]